jgi:hypothetical protein
MVAGPARQLFSSCDLPSPKVNFIQNENQFSYAPLDILIQILDYSFEPHPRYLHPAIASGALVSCHDSRIANCACRKVESDEKLVEGIFIRLGVSASFSPAQLANPPLFRGYIVSYHKFSFE